MQVLLRLQLPTALPYFLAGLRISGGLALILADQWLGWPNTYRVMGVLFVVMAGITLLAPRTPTDDARIRSDARREWRGFVAMVVAGGLAWWALDAATRALLTL
jgi:PAT family beta-lactamase induction signal transducer AmpG